MKIELKVLDKELYKVDKMGGSYYDVPSYQTPGSAAMDLISAEDVLLYPGECKLIKTGIAIWLGSSTRSDPLKKLIGQSLGQWGDYAALILPRSGRGHKEGLILGNTAGLIDEDYQGELVVSTWNRGNYNIYIQRGERFAQMVFIPIIKTHFGIVEEFSSNTERARGGFGSTGN